MYVACCRCFRRLCETKRKENETEKKKKKAAALTMQQGSVTKIQPHQKLEVEMVGEKTKKLKQLSRQLSRNNTSSISEKNVEEEDEEDDDDDWDDGVEYDPTTF